MIIIDGSTTGVSVYLAIGTSKFKREKNMLVRGAYSGKTKTMSESYGRRAESTQTMRDVYGGRSIDESFADAVKNS